MITRRMLAAAAGALAALTVLAGCSAGGARVARASAVSPRVVVSAHRGGAGQWPQNSLLAFRSALAAGYDEIEADTWITRDGVGVIYHDATIDPARCPGPFAGRRIWLLTARQVATVRCDRQPIPTERQLIDLVARSSNRHTVLRLEAKAYPGQPPGSARAWATRVAGLVVRSGLARRAIMEDFDWAGIAGFRVVSPQLRASALITRPSDAAVREARRLHAYDLSYAAAYSTAALNSYISRDGLVPTVWGLDPVPLRPGPPPRSVRTAAIRAFDRVVCQGVRVVITNYPQLLDAARRRLPACRRGERRMVAGGHS